MPPDMLGEHVTFLRPKCLNGLDLLYATYTRQTFSRHSHDGYALGVIENGGLAFRYLHRDHVAAKGEINLVVPGECHDGRPAGSGGWTYRMLYLSADLVRTAARELDLGLPDFNSGVLRDEDLAAAIRATHLCLADSSSCVLEKESRLLLLLTQWIQGHAEERGRATPSGREHAAVRRAREYLAEHFTGNPNLADIAAAAALSPFHLLRVFAHATGRTPHAYLTQLRVDRARELLSSHLSLARIASECGFADQSHLTRLFRRQLGLTPGNYRKILQNS